MIAHKNPKIKILIPHWITVHGYKKNTGYDFLVFDSRNKAGTKESAWWSEQKLFKLLDLNRTIKFSLMLVIIK
jgi:hypothetical protein